MNICKNCGSKNLRNMGGIHICQSCGVHNSVILLFKNILHAVNLFFKVNTNFYSEEFSSNPKHRIASHFLKEKKQRVDIDFIETQDTVINLNEINPVSQNLEEKKPEKKITNFSTKSKKFIQMINFIIFLRLLDPLS